MVHGGPQHMEARREAARRMRKPMGAAGHGDAYEKAKDKPLGEGSRFKAIEKDAREGGAKDPAAVAAAAGMKKHGKQKMAEMAAAGKKHD